MIYPTAIWIFPQRSFGKQYVANCVMAVVCIFLTPADNLDCILVVGNKFELEIGSQHDNLLISNFP